MGPSERSHQHGPPLLGRVQVGYLFPGVIARMQPSDSLIPIGLGSGRPLPSAYPGARATRSNEGLPGVRAVLFQRAVVVDPAGCGALLAHGAGPAVAFRLHEALGTQEDVVSRLQGLRPTRSRTYASATALPRSPQGSLPAWVGWPLTGRGSHPLDDTQGFMTYSSIPLDRPAWPHHATTPRRVAGGGSGRTPPAWARRCCTNRHWPARCPPAGSSPADAIRHWSAEGGQPIQDLTAEDDLTPLSSWAPGAKAIADDGLVSEERVLHPALTMVP